MSWIFTTPQEDEVALLARAAELLAARAPGLLSRDELMDATRAHGADLATAMALHAIREAPGNRDYLARLAATPAVAGPVETAGPEQTAAPLLIVPTMYHRERPELGGDGRLVRAVAGRLGLRATLAATPSLGDISGNAAVLIALLEPLTEPVLVVSISKGGSDLKRALDLRPDLWSRLRGWIALAGMPGGTPLADGRPGRPIANAMLHAWLRLRGAHPGMLAEMAPQHPYSLAVLTPPPGFPLVNVVPLPMSFHLRQPVDRPAAFLAGLGPNDGYVLLADALLPGRVVPLFGADHYLRVAELTPLLYRLLRLHAAGGGA